MSLLLAAICFSAFFGFGAVAQRAVYPLIVDGVAPNGARAHAGVVNHDQISKSWQTVWRSKKVDFALAANSQYVRTSGSPKTCRQHSDCYSLREPNEWCPMPASDQYYDKGCYCDASRGQCIIERQGLGGSEHTDCTDKGSSKCTGGGGGASVQGVQFSEVNDAKSNTVELKPSEKEKGGGWSALSPQSVYIRTSAKAKSCRIHDDCYAMREPDEWCPLPSTDKYSEKGCFCDRLSEKCAIERRTANGGGEYSDCAEKSTSKCQNLNVQFSDIQQVLTAGEDESAKAPESNAKRGKWNGNHAWLTVSPQARYAPTSGRLQPCLSHTDCYRLREPNEWCPLPENDRYYEKGCFCDYARNVCAIEREVPAGSEYTDCAEKTSSACLRVLYK